MDSLAELVILVGTLAVPAGTMEMEPLFAFERIEAAGAQLVSNFLRQERSLQVCQRLHWLVFHNLGRNACFQERRSRSLSRNGWIFVTWTFFLSIIKTNDGAANSGKLE